MCLTLHFVFFLGRPSALPLHSSPNKRAPGSRPASPTATSNRHRRRNSPPSIQTTAELQHRQQQQQQQHGCIAAFNSSGGGDDPSNDPSGSATTTSAVGDPQMSERRRWARRVAKYALPIQVALVAIICAVVCLEPHCCDTLNNNFMSFTPQLRYVRGPPPI